MSTAVTAQPAFEVSNWRPVSKSTLRGFFSVTTPAGLIVHDVALHRKGDNRWISLPCRPFNKEPGVIVWNPILEFVSPEAKRRFQVEALAALDAYLAGYGGK